LHVRGGDGDAPLPFFRRIVDRIERPEHDLGIVLLQHLGDGRRQRGLAVIDVPDRPHVHVRLGAIKFFLGHAFSLSLCFYADSNFGAGDGNRTRPTAWKAVTLPLSYSRPCQTLELMTGIEPVTSPLPRECSTN